MRLSKIKLAGFKSFVDPTSIPLPSNLIGVVGPNGCGKSNVIDAVRWVMGESSAKHLRGDSMADVIFNGSSARKPVGQASIEMIFDNSDGSLGGQYATYSEISIKRTVSRDGQSTYFQNGTRCRRKDITDIFLGTGLGPRSYSIIEQGMISRLIEAKPEDLRVFLEEAAGISKYKERRRETENRIRHTRENLERLMDLREELAKQLAHLHRQSKTAEKFKTLKEEERLLKAQLTALRWQDLDAQNQSKEGFISDQENQFESTIAQLRNVEAETEKQREQHIESTEAFNEVQAQYYSVGSEIARIEQSIQHSKENRQQQQDDLKKAELSWAEAQAHIKSDITKIEELSLALEESEPLLELAREKEEISTASLKDAEETMNQWQNEWDEFNQHAAEPAQNAQVERTKVQHLEEQFIQHQQRNERLTEELQGLSTEQLAGELEQLAIDEDEIKQKQGEIQDRLQFQQQTITDTRDQLHQFDQQLNESRSQQQSQKGRLSSLEALQQAALGKQEGVVTSWLEQNGLAQAKRLAQGIEVQTGWETSVETVLGFHLESLCVDGLSSYTDAIQDLQKGAVSLFDTHTQAASFSSSSALDRLQDKVSSAWNLSAVLSGIYCVDSVDQAMAQQEQLSAHESIVTRDGVWVGKGWLRISQDVDEKAGVLQREQEIQQISAELMQLETILEQLEANHAQSKEKLQVEEQQREQLQSESQTVNQQLNSFHGKISAKQARLEQIRTRSENIQHELDEIAQKLTDNEQETAAHRSLLNEALAQMEEYAIKRDQLSGQRDVFRDTLNEVRHVATNDRDEAHKIALLIQTNKTELASTQQNQVRMDSQLSQLGTRREELEQAITDSEAPMQQMNDSRAEQLQKRVEIEASLSEARRAVADLDHSMRELTTQRHKIEQEAERTRGILDQARMSWQEIKVRRQTLEESLRETGFELKQLFEEMPEGANEAEWQEQVEKMAQRIQRLGPINLAAIDEYQTQLERKEYLDAQYDDLTEALTTLENAIKKIDRETRARFRETYDKVNNGFKTMFPRLFGGGQAYLELTGEDLLDTGVTVMAQPPGKRNSTIHLLSGGEKALTAVALVFSIFQLNPAPFCMLDEVDAPLDDANVGRFCKMVKEMSEHVQFIFITHNKITMEMANQLNGVTMNEPGVSRLVAVDVEEAVDMVAMSN